MVMFGIWLILLGIVSGIHRGDPNWYQHLHDHPTLRGIVVLLWSPIILAYGIAIAVWETLLDLWDRLRDEDDL